MHPGCESDHRFVICNGWVASLFFFEDCLGESDDPRDVAGVVGRVVACHMFGYESRYALDEQRVA